MLSTESSPPAERESDPPAGASARPTVPRVLVLLAAHNGAPWIRKQVESILAQESVEVQLIVRDDGSTDETRAELDRFSRRITVVADGSPTGSAAGNFLTLIRENSAAGAGFVAFADQDDLWDTDKLRRACDTLSTQHAAGYSSATIAEWEDGRRVLLEPGVQTRSDYLLEGAGQGCTFVLTAELYERVRRLLTQRRDLTDGLHYHDWATYALARAWGLRWSFDPQPSVHYRQHAGNDTGARGTVGGVVKRFALIRRGWYRKQVLAIAELCYAAAPANTTVAAWRSVLRQPGRWRKRWQIAGFCLRGGRRRLQDNATLILAALAGWI